MGDDSGVHSDNFDWNTEDELEIENFHSSSSCLTNVPNGEATMASCQVHIYVLVFCTRWSISDHICYLTKVYYFDMFIVKFCY
ncbi:hypothetical protein Lalb_Chr05g0228281 [Lupinus albus]|uniref:Uncharacterized protein n=1 Tax=Lupinus albus TaxID=3870 RepID=A0A6A4QLN1_LUPAL|nr:hypothetical protein Lalb_Chr05g0228281 [Lupinus albus]